MRLPSIARFAATAKAALTKHETLSPLQNLEAINDAIHKLTAALGAYNGGLLAAAPIAGHESAVILAMKNAIKDAKAVEVPPPEEADAEAKETLAYMRATLFPSFEANVRVVREKKDAFAAAGLLSSVLTDMNDLRALTGELAAVLLEKTPAQYVKESKEVLGAIQAQFEELIKFCA